MPQSAHPTYDSELIHKYGGEGPRYTSYPTAVQFTEDFGANAFAAAIAESNRLPMPADLSIYVHVPFCTSPCFYCACNRIITRSTTAGDEFLASMERELELVAPRFDQDRKVRQLHLGGGTPTFLDTRQIQHMLDRLRSAFQFDEQAELALEVDPRTIDAAGLATLSEFGFNRLSMGVQDLDPEVQKAVNRIHDAEVVAGLISAARESGFGSISVDLIYGLPLQTTVSFADTIEQIIEMNPDRISLFNYAHLPHRFKAQRQIRSEQLPSGETKLALFRNSLARLLAAGYEFIGMDHFARPEDSLVQARRNGTMVRNFQGYSTHGGLDLISFGPSAISQVGDCFAQNHRQLDAWNIALIEGRLPVARGLARTTDDRLRAEIIERIMCTGRLQFRSLEREYELRFATYFAKELEQLQPLAEDGLLKLDEDGLEVTPNGLLFLRAIAKPFDAYLSPAIPGQSRFSRIV